jgi:tryptophan 2,3-dioxygenase
MFAGELWRAEHMLDRVAEIERVLIKQVDVLDTMTPQDFLAFRSLLAPASGFQSVRFRELEFLSGAKEPAFLRRLDLTDDDRKALEARLAEPSLWDAFVDVLRQRGLPSDDDDQIRESLLRVARDPAGYGPVWELSEGLLSHDANAANWRYRHVTTVERLIGAKSGTGGSTGGPYLRGRLGLRYFPLLWELRSYL